MLNSGKLTRSEASQDCATWDGRLVVALVEFLCIWNGELSTMPRISKTTVVGTGILHDLANCGTIVVLVGRPSEYANSFSMIVPRN